MVIRYCLTGAVALAAAGPLAAQTLSLHDALRRADAGAYANRIARGAAATEDARAAAALRGILPSARLEAGWLRTTDPVGVFGVTLRQRTVTVAAFDPATLNHPTATTDVNGAAVLEMPLVHADAWLARRAARAGAGAAAAAARWTAAGTGVEVVRGYFGAQLAVERVTVLEAALRAARDQVRAAGALAANGLTTRSDALLAAVRAADLDADLVAARADAALARASLATLFGDDGDTTFVLPAALPPAERILALVTAAPAPAPATRADLAAARLALDAAGADRDRARVLLLPRINAFARYDWHAAAGLFSGTPGWTAGLMASWSPFSGGAELAESRAAASRLAAARATADAAEAGARLDMARRDADAVVAAQRLAIARTAVAQGTEAHRLVARRYESGLASVVELLDAAAIDTRTRLRESAARFDLIVAVAARLQARGVPLTLLEGLDP